MENKFLLKNKLKILYFFFVVLSSYFYVDPIEWVFSSWTNNVLYQHSLLFIIPVLFYVFYSLYNLKLSLSENKGQVIWATTISFIFYLIYYKFKIMSVGVFSYYLIFLGPILYYFGLKRIYQLVFILLLTIPLPYIQELTSLLQISTCKAAVLALNLIGLEAVRDGSKIVLETGRFIIGPASSGVRSFLVLPCFFILLSSLLGLSLLRSGFGLVYTFMISIVVNWIRVFSMFVLATFTTPHYAYDLFHDKGNTLFFIISLLLILLFSYVLKVKFEKH